MRPIDHANGFVEVLARMALASSPFWAIALASWLAR